MRITLRLSDELHHQAKAEAERLGISLSQLVEEGLRLRLQKMYRVELPTVISEQPFDYSPKDLKRLILDTDYGGDGGESFFAERAARASRERFDAAMARVPDVPPLPGDELPEPK